MRSLLAALLVTSVAGTASAADAPDVTGVVDRDRLVVSGYVQAQLESSQLSEDQRAQGGAPLNFDRFLVRRGRLRVDRRWQLVAGALEIDGSNTRGAYFGVRRAEASLVFDGDKGAPPLLMLTAGLTEIPFGFELNESSRLRFFMERSTASRAFFPGEPDTGLRAQGAIGYFRYAMAVLNGNPVDDRAGDAGGRDFNRAKDVVARFGFDSGGTKWRFAGGVSMLRGQGFHPGTDATKGSVVWQDLNENSTVDPGEIKATPDVAAQPSLNFGRWAVGADLRVALRTVLGLSRFAGEVYVASNLDRGLFVADPYAPGATGDVRHLGWYASFLQDLGPYAVAGVRVDVFDPNSDFLDKRSGRFVPATQTITTLSPIVGAVLADRARLLVQYDFVRDHLARDARGVPTDLKNDLLTVRVQVEL